MDMGVMAADLEQTVTDLSAKVREVITMGKPGEAVDYAAALGSVCEAYWHIASVAAWAEDE